MQRAAILANRIIRQLPIGEMLRPFVHALIAAQLTANVQVIVYHIVRRPILVALEQIKAVPDVLRPRVKSGYVFIPDTGKIRAGASGFFKPDIDNRLTDFAEWQLRLTAEIIPAHLRLALL